MTKPSPPSRTTRESEREGHVSAEEDWKPVRQLRAYEQVLIQIEERIRAGLLRPGDRLPGERVLSERLHVSRPSLREALRVLEALEIIVPRRGGPSDAGAVIASEPGEALTNLLRFQIALASFEMNEFVETRVIIERGAARRAATRASDEHLQEMERLLEAMSDYNLDLPEFNEIDTEFHLAVAKASGNRMLANWMQALRGAVRHEMTMAFARVEDWRASHDELVGEHRGIYEAIREGDGEEAALRIERHINKFYSQVGLIDLEP